MWSALPPSYPDIERPLMAGIQGPGEEALRHDLYATLIALNIQGCRVKTDGGRGECDFYGDFS